MDKGRGSKTESRISNFYHLWTQDASLSTDGKSSYNKRRSIFRTSPGIWETDRAHCSGYRHHERATEEGVASRDLGKAEGPEGVVPASVGLAETGGSFLFSKSDALCWPLCPELGLF